MDLQEDTPHGDMIPHLGIRATAASTSNWLIVVSDEGRKGLEGVFFTLIPRNPPLSTLSVYS